MKVKVFTPFGLANQKLDDRGWMELPEGATLGMAVSRLGLPGLLSKLCMVRLNGESLPLDTPLKAGDVISYFALLRGG